ncbi:MAG: isoamylase early set domain-containing protein [Gemmatimonadota bacterium]|nr:isoamylase early set domain-containing protein [Gemmatimonadota bacterium]MDE3128836.1 isoamylase early set domain-containing protein [Gemmatimonadota bacterium]MDE3174074.1 isoamylase early set domain-containing protein [Gemmatimonadota bacterium]MDE3215295.1 isoamylase early set domain-containing protein [Gemmatimonadota bacterium]
MPDVNGSRLDEVIAGLRRPVPVDPSFDSRVMRAIRAVARQPMRIIRPLMPIPRWRLYSAFAAVAAGMLAVAVLPAMRHPKGQPVQFVLVAPDAKTVQVVGDFNGWDANHAQYAAANRGGGVWSLTTPIPPGHHRYAFLVDDSLWVPDPAAPRVADEDFGLPNSALVVEDNDTP